MATRGLVVQEGKKDGPLKGRNAKGSSVNLCRRSSILERHISGYYTMGVTVHGVPSFGIKLQSLVTPEILITVHEEYTIAGTIRCNGSERVRFDFKKGFCRRLTEFQAGCNIVFHLQQSRYPPRPSLDSSSEQEGRAEVFLLKHLALTSMRAYQLYPQPKYPTHH